MSEKTSTPVGVHTHTDLSLIHDARNIWHKSHFFTRKSRRRCERDTEKKNLLRTARKSGLCGREKKVFSPPPPPPRRYGNHQSLASNTIFPLVLYSTKLVKSRPFTTFQVLAASSHSSRRGIGRLGSWEGKEQFCPPPSTSTRKRGWKYCLVSGFPPPFNESRKGN